MLKSCINISNNAFSAIALEGKWAYKEEEIKSLTSGVGGGGGGEEGGGRIRAKVWNALDADLKPLSIKTFKVRVTLK